MALHSEKAINAGVLMINSSQRMKEWRVPGTDLFNYGKSIARPDDRLSTEFYQVRIIYNREIKKGFKKISIPFEFSSEMICRTKDEAIGYAKYYLNELIKSGDLPEDVITFGNKIDDSKIKIGIASLKIALMDKDVSDK